MNIDQFRQQIKRLLDGQRVQVAQPDMYAAHYTSGIVPRILLSKADSNHMRQYDGDYMNDPEEGRYLVDVMIRAAKASNHSMSSAFVERLVKLRTTRLLFSAYQKCTFLSCWTTTYIKSGQEEASDSLNHWRFYGDDGKGSCLMVPVANLLTVFPDSLFRVTYGTNARGGGTSAATRPVRQLEDALKERFNSMRKSYNNAMADLDEVIQATHPLLFLFKSTEYSAEKEVRSVVHKAGYSTEHSVIFDDRSPARAFVKSVDGLISNGSIVYFGPKSERTLAIEAMGKAANLGVDIRVFVSAMPYR